MHETLIKKKRIPDAADPDPNPAPPASPAERSEPAPGDPQAGHVDDPENPTTPYDHIWYDRRPLH